VDLVRFAFANGRLFRIVVKYDSEKIEGLTAEDLTAGISAQYGMPNQPVAAMLFDSQLSGERVQVLSRWENSAYSFDLVQLPYSSSFELVVIDKTLNLQAESAIAESIQLDAQEAPGLLKLAAQHAKTDADKDRVAKIARFRP
jgi:hypothetical protein